MVALLDRTDKYINNNNKSPSQEPILPSDERKNIEQLRYKKFMTLPKRNSKMNNSIGSSSNSSGSSYKTNQLLLPTTEKVQFQRSISEPISRLEDFTYTGKDIFWFRSNEKNANSNYHQQYPCYQQYQKRDLPPRHEEYYTIFQENSVINNQNNNCGPSPPRSLLLPRLSLSTNNNYECINSTSPNTTADTNTIAAPTPPRILIKQNQISFLKQRRLRHQLQQKENWTHQQRKLQNTATRSSRNTNGNYKYFVNNDDEILNNCCDDDDDDQELVGLSFLDESDENN